MPLPSYVRSHLACEARRGTRPPLPRSPQCLDDALPGVGSHEREPMRSTRVAETLLTAAY